MKKKVAAMTAATTKQTQEKTGFLDPWSSMFVPLIEDEF